MSARVRLSTLGFVSLVGLGIGGGVLCVALQDGEPSMVDAYLFEEDGRAYLAVVETRSFRGKTTTHHHRLVTYDPSTGQVLATVDLTQSDRTAALRLFRRVDHRMWTVASEHGVRLLDLCDGRTLLDEAAIVAAIPELASGIRPVEGLTINEYTSPTTGLPLVLHDGREAWLSMDPELRFEPVPTEPWKPGYFCGPDGGAKPSCERTECIAFQSVEGSTGLVLGMAPMWQGKVIEVDPKNETVPDARSPVRPPEPFLRPGLVRLHDTECAFEHEGRVLVLHDSASFDPKEPLLTLASRDGRRVWTRHVRELLPVDSPFDDDDAPKPEPFEAAIVQGELVVLLSEPRLASTLAVARLDPESGEVRSSFVAIPPD